MCAFATITPRRLHLGPLVKPTSGLLFSCRKVNILNRLRQMLVGLFLSRAEAVFSQNQE
jgi:hypothetical protein